jgi:hypothetical protein
MTVFAACADMTVFAACAGMTVFPKQGAARESE